jgi:hypothetical protein
LSTSPSYLLRISLLLTSLLWLNACNETHEVLGQAYIAPQTLHVRSDLSAKSSNIAELKHGAQVGIVDVQRRMVKIRTAKGQEGWVDSLDLLSADQWNAISQLRQQQALLPPQATATAFESLNVHIDPSRSSPAFVQIPEGGSVAVLGHRVAPKVTAPMRAPGFTVQRPQSQRKQRKEQKDHNTSFRLPPKPAPPKPPANWLALSAERIDGGEEPAAATTDKTKPSSAKPEPAAKPLVLEDWTLIRTKANEIGWVLTRNLLFSIPDEVAQYAEGKHITAFFDLGAVNDEIKGQKHNWLWTTAASALPYDFDAWRVFTWNTRHHRFETSFRQRDLEGYFPVHVDPAEPGSLLRNFQIVTRDADGKMRRRSYTFDGRLVHAAGTEDYQPGKANSLGGASAINTSELQSKLPRPGWLRRQWAVAKHRLFGT